MKRTFLTKAFLPIVVFTIFSCTANDEFQSFDGFEKSKDVSFDIAITRDGKISTRSDGGYGNIVTETDKDAKLDPSKPFGLMGVDPQTSAKGLLVKFAGNALIEGTVSRQMLRDQCGAPCAVAVNIADHVNILLLHRFTITMYVLPIIITAII